MKSQWVKNNIFAILGFVCCNIAPIICFGFFFSYTKSGFWAKFTVWFFIAMVIFLVIVVSKLKKKVENMKRGYTRGALLSLFRLVFVGACWIGVNGIINMGEKLKLFVITLLVCELVGSVFYLLDEEKHTENKDGE